MASLLDLANRLEKKAAAYEKKASKKAVDAALAIVGDLLFETPVDTSRALSNWQVSLDAPINYSIQAYYMGDQGSTQVASVA